MQRTVWRSSPAAPSRMQSIHLNVAMTTTPNSTRGPLLFGALLGLAVATAPSLARAMEAGQGRLSLTPAQQQKLFPEWRQLTLQTTQGRIAILQKQQQCVSAASSMEALRTCQQQERQAMLEQRQQQREAMRQLLQRNGITPPPPRQDGGTRRLLQQPDGPPMI